MVSWTAAVFTALTLIALFILTHTPGAQATAVSFHPPHPDITDVKASGVQPCPTSER